ncbi:hypothetical protein ACHAQH_004333 [Verticillium albo-atrum]
MVRDEDNLPRFMVTGTGAAMASNRVSHFFDLRGASLTLDTGCSSSLVALHQAVQSLRNRESDMAVVGSANLMLNPDMFKALGSISVLSPDGRSYSFDSRANGYGRGEGVATLVIKRLKDALAAGDPVRAVIRETSLNQDGKTETITSPRKTAQEELMRTCYRSAGLDPRDTQYFEAHGTGTPTGDPIEIQAVAAVFQPGRSADEPLRLGSVKANIGHTEPVSGLASVVKVVLALEKGLIPPSINFATPNAALDLDQWCIKVPMQLEAWPVPKNGLLRASINNFGYGGTNAHMILERPDSRPPGLGVGKHTNGTNGRNGTYESNGTTGKNGISRATNGVSPSLLHIDPITDESKNGTKYRLGSPRNKTKLLILSARDERTCKKVIANVKTYLEDQLGQQQQKQNTQDNAEILLQSLVYTVGQRRTRFNWVASQPISYTQGIGQVIEALESPKLKPVRTSRQPRIGMVFTGQGAQWHAMGRELIIAYPVFKASLEEGDGHLRALGADWSLMEELHRDAGSTRVNETAVSIPICAALQISLVRLLRDWGIKPTSVTSHSSGEIAAAYTVGAIDYRAAMGIAYHRSVLAADKRFHGSVASGMAAIGVGPEEAEGYLQQAARSSSGEAVVACTNSPKSVTIAGDLSVVQAVESMVKKDGLFASRLKVDIGYHSHHMKPMADPYLDALRSMVAGENDHNNSKNVSRDQQHQRLESIAFYSPVTGDRMTSVEDIIDPNHWVQSLVRPVQFLDAFSDMILGDFDPSGSGVDVILEVGPHTALRGPIRQIMELPEFSGLQIPYYGCLSRNASARDTLQAMASNLVSEGYPVNLEAINFPWGRSPEVTVLTDLPWYPWNHQTRHWTEPRFNKALRERRQAPHDLLGSVVLGCNMEAPSWRHTLRTSDAPWIRDHMVQSNVLYPGAGFACLVIEAAAQTAQTEAEAETGGREQVRPAGSRVISGYRLRDVDIRQALLVPETPEGIEIQTTLRPVDEKAIGTKGWKHFTVSSVTADNRWTEHARGLISVEYEGTAAKSGLGLGLIDIGVNGQRTMAATSGRRIVPEDMFASFRSVGIHHGPAFQNLKGILQSYTGQRSTTILDVASTAGPYDVAHSHVIHPTTLDSVVQAAYTALDKAGHYQESARVPNGIKHMWVSSRISHEAGHRFRAQAVVRGANAQGFEADVILADHGAECGADTGSEDMLESGSENGAGAGAGAGDSHGARPVLEIQGLAFQSLGQTVGVRGDKPWENDICNTVEWAADLSLASHATLNDIKTRDLDFPLADDSITADLRPVCIAFIRNALNGLTPADVASLSGHMARFYTWMQDQVRLAKLGKLGPGSEQWLSHSTPEQMRRIQLASAASVTGEMVCRLGPQLAAMVRGETAPLELMMQDRLLTRYYGDAKLERCFTQLASLLRRAVHKNPRARILEIGAGTGSVTRHALTALGSAASGGPLAGLYHYTDVSQGFFEAARDDFAAWSDLLVFDRLDIEANPATQGFQPGSYDIIIACEVLHATKSISSTLDNVHNLMKPHATLLLIETTRDQLDVQLVFGLLPGWWLGEEDYRKDSPSLSVPQWDLALKQSGFTGVDVEARDCKSVDAYAFSTIMSRVKSPQPPMPSSDDIVLVTYGKASGPPTSWISSLQRSIAGSGSLPDVQALDSIEGTTAATYSGKICVFLGDMSQSVLFDVEPAALEGIKLFTANCSGFLWVTVGGSVECSSPGSALAAGFVRSLRNEYVGRRFVTLDLDPCRSKWSHQAETAIVEVLQHSFGTGDAVGAVDAHPVEFEYAERNGVLLIPRCFKDVNKNKIVSPEAFKDSSDQPLATALEPLHQTGRTLGMKVGVPGLLDTLVFDDDARPADVPDSPLPDDFVEIDVRAYGLNFRDVMVAMGQLEDKVMGLECSGIIACVGKTAASHGHKVGDGVFCLLRGPFGNRAQTEHWNVVRMPAGKTFAEAASLPMIFTTAYTALVDVARLQRGQSVLIHAAAGGVGQAAIMLAQHLGAEIYVTVGSPDKRDFLIRTYGIPDHHIFNSRDTSFAPGILAATGGHGVDVLLNSLAGPLLQESFNIVAPFGTFVEIGKRDLEQSSFLEMRPFTRHVSFCSLDVLAMTRGKGHDVRRILTEIARMAELKIISPVHPLTTYPMTDIGKAFRRLQTGKHTGKLVLSVGRDDIVPVQQREKTARLSPDASYLLVGGVGGIGKCVANWLVAIGARNLILLSRSAGGTGKKSSSFLKELRDTGCRVEAISCDVSDTADLSRALVRCKNNGLPAIRGVIQAAMVLQDSILEQMTLDSFKAAILPKVHGTWNLHAQFQQVDFFLMLSSINGIVGYASQSNYSAGGSYQDALARWRVARGLPAVSIDLCAVKTVGYVAETKGVAGRMRRVGHMLLREDQLLGLLGSAILAPFDPQVIAGLNTGPGPHWDSAGESQLGRDARFIALEYRQQQQQRGDGKQSEAGSSLANGLAETTSRAEAESLVVAAITNKLSEIFVISIDEVDPAQHPSHYGVDSLVAVELRNMLSHQAAADISIFSILQTQSLNALASEVASKSRFVQWT